MNTHNHMVLCQYVLTCASACVYVRFFSVIFFRFYFSSSIPSKPFTLSSFTFFVFLYIINIFRYMWLFGIHFEAKAVVIRTNILKTKRAKEKSRKKRREKNNRNNNNNKIKMNKNTVYVVFLRSCCCRCCCSPRLRRMVKYACMYNTSLLSFYQLDCVCLPLTLQRVFLSFSLSLYLQICAWMYWILFVWVAQKYTTHNRNSRKHVGKQYFCVSLSHHLLQIFMFYMVWICEIYVAFTWCV